MKKILLWLLVFISTVLFLVVASFPRFYWLALIALLILGAYYLFVYRPKKKNSLYSLIFIPLLIIIYHIGIYFDQNYDYCLDSRKPKEWKGWNKPLAFKMNEIDSLIDSKAERFRQEIISQVFNANDTFNIKLLTNSTDKKRNSILILAGAHGCEPAGVFSIPLIIDKIKENKYQDWDFDIIYAVNPVGLENFTRHNEIGCDITHDFNNFMTLQARIIKNLIDTSSYKLVLDIHEGPYSGSVIFKNRLIKHSLKRRITQDLRKQNIVISEYNNRLNIPVRLKLYSMNSFLAKITSSRTLSHYLTERGIMSLVSESDAFEEDFNQRIKNHVVVFESMMDYLTEE